MRSISGFNSGSLDGSFAAGQPISASALNKLAGSVDKNRPMMSNDIQFLSGMGGTAMGMPQQLYQQSNLNIFNPNDNGDGTFSVIPGTINSLIPCVGSYGGPESLATYTPAPKAEYDWSEADEEGYQYCYIYLQASPAAQSGGRIWPSSDFTTPEYPTIYGYPEKMDDDDETGFILLALAKKKTNPDNPNVGVSFNYFINNSLWSERHKYSQPDSAYYFFYRV